MGKRTEPLKNATRQRIHACLQRLKHAKEIGPDLNPVLDIAIDVTGADMGTLQRFDESTDSLKLVASSGFSDEALSFFRIVRRDTNTTCAAALTRRMRVFVGDISNSYLFVGTRELDMMSAEGIVAAQSTPLISSIGRLLGVLTTHFRKPKMENEFDPALLDQFALQIADCLEQRRSLATSPHSAAILEG